MKRSQAKPIRLFVGCIAVFVVNEALFQIMARTHMMEKIMAMTFDAPEFLLIALFLAFRFTVYLFIVPALLALGVHALTKRALDSPT